MDTINKRTIFNEKGEAWDNIKGDWTDGKPELGHVYGHEFAYERNVAEEKGWTQKQFNDYMNNAEFYFWQDKYINRSHKEEAKH